MSEHPLPHRVVWRESFPLLTDEIEKDLKHIKRLSGSSTLNDEHIIQLMQSHPFHFDSLFGAAAKGRALVRSDEGRTIYKGDVECIKKYIEASFDFLIEVSDTPHDEILQRYEEIFHTHRLRDLASAKELDKKRFFSLLHAELDEEQWSRWLKMATWTEEEATALTFGKNPDVVCSKAITDFLATCRDKRSHFADEYQWRLRLLARVVEAGELGNRFKPDEYIEWAKKVFGKLPENMMRIEHTISRNYAALVEENERLRARVASFSQNLDNMNVKAKTSILRVLIVMAVHKFGYKLDRRSSATSLIINAFSDYNLDITDKTVKGVLDDAAADPLIEDDVGAIRAALTNKSRTGIPN